MAVYGYCRVSTDEQGGETKTSLDLQRRKIEGIALACDWPVDLIVADKISGSTRFQDRPEGSALWKRFEAGDKIIVAKLDRMFRSARDALNTSEELATRKVDLILLDIGMEPVNSSLTGKLFFTIVSAMAEFERGRIKERQREAIIAKRRMGGHLGGLPPFGYRVEGKGAFARLVEIPEEQAAIRKAQEMRAASASMRTISAAILAEFGLKISHKGVQKALDRCSAAAA